MSKQLQEEKEQELADATTPDASKAKRAPRQMALVDQTKFGADGDCFDACLATLLGLPIEKVDYFRKEEAWYGDCQKWLAQFGLTYLEIDIQKTKLHWLPQTDCIFGGPSNRGIAHAVVGRVNRFGYEIIHDPHPSRDSLVTIESVGFLVPRRALSVFSLNQAYDALDAIERIVGDDFCEDLEMRACLPDQPELPADLRTAQEKLGIVYQIAHSESPRHSCHHVHTEWRKVKERIL